LFFNELEVLEIRLNEMYDQVDHFVLVECVESFVGNPKLLHYARNKDRFKEFHKKIIHVIVSEKFQGGYWDREAFQRNQILRGLNKCSKNDIVIISDLDEIVRGSDIKKLVHPIHSGKHKAISAGQKGYSLYLNRQCRNDSYWTGSVATTYGYLAKKNPEKIRNMRHRIPQLQDAGWHFSSMGGLDRYITKIQNFSHADEYDSEKKDPKNIQARIQNELDLVPIDESFPRFVREHQKEFLEMGFIDYEGNPYR
jgi:hypothetical protein